MGLRFFTPRVLMVSLTRKKKKEFCLSLHWNPFLLAVNHCHCCFSKFLGFCSFLNLLGSHQMRVQILPPYHRHPSPRTGFPRRSFDCPCCLSVPMTSKPHLSPCTTRGTTSKLRSRQQTLSGPPISSIHKTQPIEDVINRNLPEVCD